MIIKRIISALTSTTMLLSMTSVFSGCSMKEFFTNESPSDSSQKADDGVITNGEWLEMVNDAFGMQVDESSETGELDAARQWGVIGEDEEIDEDAPVNDKFIATTLTRASGFATPESTDEEVINAAIEHGIISSPDANITEPQQAMESLAVAQDSWSHQTFEEHFNVELAENVSDLTNVINASDININNNDITIPSEYALEMEKDSIYILPKEAGNGNGGAYKVISSINNGDGTTTVKSVPATFEEVYRDVDIQGKFAVDYNSFEPLMDGVTISDENGNPISELSSSEEDAEILPLGFINEKPEIQQLGSKDLGQKISLSINLEDDVKLSFSLSDVALNTDIDWSYGLFKGLSINRIYMAVDYTQEIEVEAKFFEIDDDQGAILEKAFKKYNISNPSIDVGKFAVYICPGISVNLRVALSFNASGSAKITITTENTKGFEMKGSNFRSINESNTSTDFALTGEAGVYGSLTLALSLDYLVGEVDLLSLTLKVGPTLKGEIKSHFEDDPEKAKLCLDVSAYLKIELKLALMEQVLKAFGLEASITLIDVGEEKSPFKWNFHLENFKRVDKCTIDEETTEASTEATTIPVGNFEFESTYISVNAGSSKRIALKSLPSGYTADDVVWESTDSSKASVDGSGNVTANSAGTAIITATTKDGKYSASCAVNIKSVVEVNSKSSAISITENAEMIAV